MSKSVYKLYVSLKYVKPKCFRTFIIRSDCKMMTLASTLIYIFNGNASHIYSFDVPSRKLDVQIYIDEGMNESDDDFAINVRHEQPSKHVDARKYKISDCLKTVGVEPLSAYIPSTSGKISGILAASFIFYLRMKKYIKIIS